MRAFCKLYEDLFLRQFGFKKLFNVCDIAVIQKSLLFIYLFLQRAAVFHSCQTEGASDSLIRDQGELIKQVESGMALAW